MRLIGRVAQLDDAAVHAGSRLVFWRIFADFQCAEVGRARLAVDAQPCSPAARSFFVP